MKPRIAISSALAALLLLAPAQAEETAELYREHCAACHGTERLGGSGPALIPETLKRSKPEKIAAVIAEGRPQTQMPAFEDILPPQQIAALAAHLKTPLGYVPTWEEVDIAASLTRNPDYAPVTAPTFAADPLNLFVVVETGDHRDLHSFPTRRSSDLAGPRGRWRSPRSPARP